MSQHKGRLEVGEGGKSHRGEQGRKEGDDKRSLWRQGLEIWTQQVQLLRPLSVRRPRALPQPYGNLQHFLTALARVHTTHISRHFTVYRALPRQNVSQGPWDEDYWC